MGLAIWFPESFAYCAVDCFAIITGYVYSTARFRYSNLASLWLRAAYYSLGVTLIFFLLGDSSIGKRDLVKAMLPIGFKEYWFLTAYAGMFLFIPILNAAVEKFKGRRLHFITAALLTVFSAYATLVNHDTFSLAEGYSAWWLMILYLVGAAVRSLEEGGKRYRKAHLLVFAIVMGTTTCLSRLVIPPIEDTLLGVSSRSMMFVSYTSPTVVGMAIALVMLFSQQTVPARAQGIVAKVSKLSFSVYLIHEHPLIRSIIASFSERIPMVNPPIFIASVLAFACAVFATCVLIDIPREKLSKKLCITKWLRNKEEKYLSLLHL